jgi:hypothetical protein
MGTILEPQLLGVLVLRMNLVGRIWAKFPMSVKRKS